MKIGFYAGSFDPFTNGHLPVVTQSYKIFERVIIGIGLENVTVISYDNLSVDVATEYHSTFLVRGIRNGMDYECEENMASINEEISGLDTVYIRAGNLGNISSSMVMELLRNNKDVSKYLPEEVLALVKR